MIKAKIITDDIIDKTKSDKKSKAEKTKSVFINKKLRPYLIGFGSIFLVILLSFLMICFKSSNFNDLVKPNFYPPIFVIVLLSIFNLLTLGYLISIMLKNKSLKLKTAIEFMLQCVFFSLWCLCLFVFNLVLISLIIMFVNLILMVASYLKLSKIKKSYSNLFIIYSATMSFLFVLNLFLYFVN